MTSEKTFRIICFHFIFSEHKITPRDIGSMSKIYVTKDDKFQSRFMLSLGNVLGLNIKLRLSDIFSPYRLPPSFVEEENSKVMTNNQFIIINILIPQLPASVDFFALPSVDETLFIYLSDVFSFSCSLITALIGSFKLRSYY